MNCTRHCTLCENEIRNLKTGVICAVTGLKPAFVSKCGDIKLESKFEQKLALVIFKFQELKNDEKSVHFKFYTGIIIGFAIVIGSSAYANIFRSNESGFHFLHKIVAVSVGITLISATYFKFNKFRDNIKNAQFNKNKIDDVLDLYRINYTSEVIYGDKIHGTQAVNVKIKFQNWHVKETLTLLEINY